VSGVRLGGGVLGRVTAAVLVATSVAIGLSWLVSFAAHVDDRHGIDHVSGSWMALARAVDSGTLYPPLFDGEAFGGTRFMPVPIVLQAAAARVSGEYLVSAKVLSALLMAALLVLTFVLLRRGRCPTPVALLLTGTLLVTGTGVTAATSVRNDVLPVVLQLGAVALVASSTTRRVLVAAGALCALALVSKLSAVWAPIAIVVWLLQGDRRRLLAFGGALLGVLAAAAAVFLVASDGRVVDNVVGLSLQTTGRFISLDVQVSRVRLIAREGLGLLGVLLLLLAAAGTVLAGRRRRLDLYHLAFLASLVVSAVVLVDPGAFVNHLVDAQVLAVLVVGRSWQDVSSWAGRWALAPAAIVVALLAATAVAYDEHVPLRDDVRDLVHGTTDPEERNPALAGVVRPGDTLLSEDPAVPVLLGRRPVVLDPYTLRSVGERHPHWRAALVRRIEAAEFDEIVLLFRPRGNPGWYRHIHLGKPVADAIDRRYRPLGRVEGYWVFVPAATTSAAAAPARDMRRGNA
jgi:hypothetical protein